MAPKTKKTNDEEEVKETPKTSKGVSPITFKLKSGRTRVFSREEHGEDFEAVAKEFETNNTADIVVPVEE